MLLHVARRRGIPEAALVQGIPHPLEHLRNKHERIGWDEFRTLLDNAALFFSEEEFERVTVEATRSIWMRPFLVIGRLLYNPVDSFGFFAGGPKSVGGRLYTCVDSTLEQVAPDALVLDLRLKPGFAPHALFLAGTRAVVAATPQIFGYPAAHVTMHEIERGARYEIELPSGGGALAGLRRALSYPYAAWASARELREAHELLHEQHQSLKAEVRRREELEALERDGEAKLRELTETMSDIFWLASASGEFLYVSRSYEELTGRPPPPRCGSGAWLEGIHPDDRERVRRLLAERDPEQVLEVDHRILTPSGEVRWMHSRTFPIRDPEGNVYRYAGCAVDVTERRRMQADLQERIDELARSDRDKDEFLAVLAHELRNPLAAITNAGRLLLEGNAPDAARLHATIERQAGRLSRLVDDLLDVARITQRRVELRRERVDVGRVIRNSLEAVRHQIEQAGLELLLEIPDRGPTVDADPVRLEQVVSNLLSNAVQFSKPGGTISVGARREADEVVIRVSDDGAGIPSERLSRIFEGIRRPSGAPPHSGLGMGLRIVRQLVELHGGRVSASSDGVGRGSQFTVALPSVDGWATRPAPEPRAPRMRSRRVLLIDDDPDVAETLEQIIRSWGHDVRVAPDGPTGLATAREHRPEVVVIDIGLPGMDGYTVASVIRGEPEVRDATLIALTGYGRPRDRERAKRAGFDFHLTKPDVHAPLRELLARESI
jgi:PAS domain S-box-containing protein